MTLAHTMQVSIQETNKTYDYLRYKLVQKTKVLKE